MLAALNTTDLGGSRTQNQILSGQWDGKTNRIIVLLQPVPSFSCTFCTKAKVSRDSLTQKVYSCLRPNSLGISYLFSALQMTLPHPACPARVPWHEIKGIKGRTKKGGKPQTSTANAAKICLQRLWQMQRSVSNSILFLNLFWESKKQPSSE